MKTPETPPGKTSAGFTLLEVLIVLFILGLLAAMSVPAMGLLDDMERSRITRSRMDLIRRAILGPDDRFDEKGRPLIGGYVGDMGAWPDLWEPRPEVKPDFAGPGWSTPATLSAGLGQGPDYLMNPDYVFFRPSGQFNKRIFSWNRPFRKLYNDTSTHADHIGGLETENEGQPRGLWTRYVEDLPFDLAGHTAPGAVLGDSWKGPYITAPADEVLDDAGHFAEDSGTYFTLEPLWHTVAPHANHETWEEGDEAPTSGELGEFYDEKEKMRLLKTEGCLSDGWGRAFRFFITEDKDHAGETIFWIVSEGPDRSGSYPNKGTCAGHAWTVDALDTMGRAYDETHERNTDNLVMKLYSRDYEAVFATRESDRSEKAGRLLDMVRESLVGGSPARANTGYSGDLCVWPALFRYETVSWDNQDAAALAYTKGQPLGLWTREPNAADIGDNLMVSQWGVGWRHIYLKAPEGTGSEQFLKDPWGREILFFHDTANDTLLVLSRGPDGMFDFGTVSADHREPVNGVEAVTVSTYVPTSAYNADNIHRVVRRGDRLPGFFRLDRLVLLNAAASSRCRFYRDGGSVVAGVDLLTAPAVLSDYDSDGTADDWVMGDGTASNPAFRFDDTTAYSVTTGARYLVCWDDADSDNVPDTGEMHKPLIYSVTGAAGSGVNGTVVVNTADFWAVP